jgi:site-specific recombinase XerD
MSGMDDNSVAVMDANDSGVAVAKLLSDDARLLVARSISGNTARAYKAQIQLWQAWCSRSGASPMPADPSAVASWLAERFNAGQQVSTLRTAVAAIRAGHEAASVPFDSTNAVIARTLKGAVNSRPRQAKQAKPLLGEALAAILGGMGDSLADRRDAAVLATGWLFGLRRSELVALDHAEHGHGDGWLEIGRKSINLTIVASKTGNGAAQNVTVPVAGNEKAVAAIAEWVKLAGVAKGTPLFRRVRKSGVVGHEALSDQSVTAIIRARIGEYLRCQGEADADIEALVSQFSGHSLRVGFAVSAAEAGASSREIMSVTRHRSTATVDRYCERAEQLAISPYKRMGLG